MEFHRALGVTGGVTAVIGSGGKTTLLKVLADELREKGTVLLCTTTHMFPPEGRTTLYTRDEGEIAARLAAERVIGLGRLADDGRLRTPEVPMARLAMLADYVLVEADGSRTLPLKAHAPHEPAVPPEAGRTICVAGLSGLGRPIRETAHRPERYAALAGVGEDALVTPEVAAAVLNAEGLGDCYYLNQADDGAGETLARTLAGLLKRPALWGSLNGRKIQC